MNASTQLARGIVSRLIEAGITDVVLSPGSRNAPISIALYSAEQSGLVTLHVRIDERTAGFLALGISKAAKRPVAILCTSGTAVANYHPAVLEAHHSQIPLLVITADRPAYLRQTGANQTTLQAGIFGTAVSFAADISALDPELDLAISNLHNGPVHLNVQLDEPLSPDGEANWLDATKPGRWIERESYKPEELALSRSHGVIVVGHDRAGFSVEEVEQFARGIGWPLIVEDPLSFSGAVPHAALFLSSPRIREILRPEIAIVIGRTTLSRSVNALVKSAGQEFVIDPRIAMVDVKRNATQTFLSLPHVSINFDQDLTWESKWHSYSDQTASLLSGVPIWSEQHIARAIGAKIAPGTALFVSSSRPIRDLEGFASARADVETFANRGLAGIDGNISTALGVASQRESTVALLGDLSFLHDITGLVGGVGQAHINLRIVIVNNDGGGIFSTLPQSGVPGFEKIFGTPHGHDLAAISASFGVNTTTVTSIDQLNEILLRPNIGLSVVIANVPSRDENARSLRELSAKIDSL
ncbi:MAG: 2-succinyl-5-enolpyruvyl-6-hydroxy-3-cyclohexene-1-carboxylic-acid synthase [Candidatus Nanopelagicaceae bacterium]|nr:2-succinyl-5-enolpyruvyl-6-hydroxy-3-cyclohexene-1-carboxylic-acid synthase [Candidatus Nanopelagicaceae bacterium]